ncbi:hypothetical protein M9H77_16240 [Catharanthus roseus]|uniref:Uncharacterized protein n=1 Tax=Catharanthus roseus TaxID=4058 RepID=A0ACC0AZB7_CATRO|nr:hypothetical protein M9H77_16240 [Catharanthus roseus]
MGVRLFGNRALVWCLAGIDYEMSELGSDDLVLGSGPCPLTPSVASHISLHSSVEAALISCSLVPRVTQIPYSAAVDLVAGLGVSQVVSEHLSSFLGLNFWILDKL